MRRRAIDRTGQEGRHVLLFRRCGELVEDGTGVGDATRESARADASASRTLPQPIDDLLESW